MYFLKLAKKEPEPNKTLNAVIKIAVFVGVVAAVFLVLYYICKKHGGFKSVLKNTCGCGCNEDDECGSYDEDADYSDDEYCCDDECCCCDSIDPSEDEDIEISVDMVDGDKAEEKPE